MKVIDADPVDAVDVFNQETSRWVGDNPILSLSGGFDSRVILSSMLSQGIYPTVVTLGNQQNSDMQVAEMIADKFSLDHIRVQLTVRDFIEKGEYIAYLTNGSKPSCHWHTYLYPKKSGVDKNQSFYVGTLGEFARSYYFDKGFLSLLNDSFSGLAQYRFWLLKLSRHRTFKNEEYSLLCDELKNQINTQGMQNKAKRNASLSSGDFLSGGTRYYLEQRVPNFYANGISMYNSSASWRSPFHNIRWLEKIWNLCDNWKLGSNWHRLAIYRNFPALLEFPEEKGFDTNRMLRKAPPLYWLPIMQKQKYKTYDMSADWFAQPEIQDLIWENNQLIDELIDKKLIRKILDEHVADKTRTRAISFLLDAIHLIAFFQDFHMTAQ
jgi:asparagine synthase (glutamine-hydrolysing)